MVATRSSGTEGESWVGDEVSAVVSGEEVDSRGGLRTELALWSTGTLLLTPHVRSNKPVSSKRADEAMERSKRVFAERSSTRLSPSDQHRPTMDTATVDPRRAPLPPAPVPSTSDAVLPDETSPSSSTTPFDSTATAPDAALTTAERAASAAMEASIAATLAAADSLDEEGDLGGGAAEGMTLPSTSSPVHSDLASRAEGTPVPTTVPAEVAVKHEDASSSLSPGPVPIRSSAPTPDAMGRLAPTAGSSKAPLSRVAQLSARVEKDPLDGEARLALIADAVQKGDLERTREVYEEFLKVFPDAVSLPPTRRREESNPERWT